MYVAEVLSNVEYFNPMLCDIWALGIILFMVLTGHPLVEFATMASERYRMIAEGRLQEMIESWGFDFSDEVVDLMQRLLRPVPQERISLTQIQQHPWMTALEQYTMEY
jgi:serine/threonine kinase 33